MTSDLFHTYFLSEGLSNDLLLFVGGVFLPAASLTLYAVLADRRHEKKAILVGMSLYLLGLILALARKDTAVWPLTIADGIGGAYGDFFVVGFSILFFAETKRPVLMSSLGLAIDILTASFLWTADIWLPVSFLHGSFGISHLVSMAVLTILLLVTAMLAFDRQNEKTIVSALFRRLPSESALSESDEQVTAEPTDEILLQAGFEPLEREISLLLIEGYTHSEISRRLHLSASKMRILLKQIRNKVSGVTIPNTETVLEQVTADYALTKRETQILKTLSEGKTNPEIAAELFISTETVKFHIRNLKKKIPVTERGQISSWLSTYRSQ